MQEKDNRLLLYIFCLYDVIDSQITIKMQFLNSAANFTSPMSFPAKNTVFQFFSDFLAPGTKTGTQRSKGLIHPKTKK